MPRAARVSYIYVIKNAAGELAVYTNPELAAAKLKEIDRLGIASPARYAPNVGFFSEQQLKKAG